MMAAAWNAFVFLCSVGNAIWIGAAWYRGLPPDWCVWLFAILFSGGVALRSLGELMEPS